MYDYVCGAYVWFGLCWQADDHLDVLQMEEDDLQRRLQHSGKFICLFLKEGD